MFQVEYVGPLDDGFSLQTDYFLPGRHRGKEIVRAERTGREEVFRRVSFPKETSHDRRSESVYEEFVAEYEAIEVLHGSGLRAGDEFLGLAHRPYRPDNGSGN